MRKMAAFICAAIMLTGIISVQIPGTDALAKYTSSDLERSIGYAVQWKNSNDAPLSSVGTESSDLYVIALARAGQDFDYSAYLDALDTVAEKHTFEDSVSEMQRIALTATALGVDATYFGGQDMVGNGTYYRALSEQGVMGYIGALITLSSGSYAPPKDADCETIEDMVVRVLGSQLSDGSFLEDVYTTAAGVIALSAYNTGKEYYVNDAETGERTIRSCADAIDKAITFLSERQNSYGDYDTVRETAMVSMAMDAANVSQDDIRFTSSNTTVMDALLVFQTADGGFADDFNNSDSLATSYALCAMVSNIREISGNTEFFNFQETDAPEIRITSAASSSGSSDSSNSSSESSSSNSSSSGSSSSSSSSGSSSSSSSSGSSSSGSSSSGSSSSSSSSSRNSATTAPKRTTRPASTLRATTEPKVSASPKVSPTPKHTAKPTERPDLVGPVQQVGPMPKTTDAADIEGASENNGTKRAFPIAAAAAGGIALLAAIVLFVVCKVNAGKKKEETEKAHKEELKSYKAVSHRATEQHRKFEEREKYRQREKYKQRGKYKSGRM